MIDPTTSRPAPRQLQELATDLRIAADAVYAEATRLGPARRGRRRRNSRGSA